MALQHAVNSAARFPKTEDLVSHLPGIWQGPNTGTKVKESLSEISVSLHEAIELLLSLKDEIERAKSQAKR